MAKIEKVQLLSGLPQTDWNETNETKPSYLKNKPTTLAGYGITDAVKLSDLDELLEQYVFNAQTHYDFPSIGKTNVIYKAESEQQIYQWNPTALKYEVLNSAESGGSLDIDVINGGSAALD